jgi:serine/threonine-protein kinase
MGDFAWLDRARELCTRAAHACRSDPAMGNSLYKGELGVAMLAADLLDPENARQPSSNSKACADLFASPGI